MDLTLYIKMRISPILENEVDGIINCDCFGLRESKGKTNSMQKMKKIIIRETINKISTTKCE